MIGKYSALKEFLKQHREKKIVLTLNQIEIIINSKLPKSAYSYPAWWSDPSTHPQVRNWSDIGWKVEIHSEKSKIAWVRFRKVKE